MLSQIRGLMLDSARCLENRAYYRRAIEFAAERGVNLLLWHFTDDQGCTLQFDSVPGIASPHAYSKSEMRELIEFAKQHGIMIVPELAALGHARYITRLPEFNHLDEIEHVFTGMCPVAPQTREVLTKLLNEVVEVFDAPHIHVGLDEANIGHHPLTRKALLTRKRDQIIADHINFLHEQVRRHGRTMMMWGDGLLHDEAILRQISTDIVICDWQYHANVDGKTTQRLLDAGFNVVLCPALICHDQPLFPGEQLALNNLRSTLRQLSLRGKGKILGIIETVWQPERYMHDSLWIGLDQAMAMMRQGSDVQVDQAAARFAQDFYGMLPSAEWIQACRDIYRLAPMRAEWLAVLKMDIEHLPAPAEITQRAADWRRIAKTLAGAEHQVTRNQQAYRTFTLMVELLTHLYHKSELLDAATITPIQARQVLETERALIERVDAVWDCERFADDPKKRTAARECFRENNLLAMLHAMSPRTQELFGEAAAEMRSARASKRLQLTLNLPKTLSQTVRIAHD